MKHITKILSLLLAAVMLLSMAACGNQKPAETTAGTTAEAAQTTASGAEETTAPKEQKPVLLAVSFGTSYNESREATIGAVEAALQEANPDYEVRRAFTSQIIIDILKDREKLEIDNVKEAMDRLVADGVKEVIVQPTHVMPGFEYDDVRKEVAAYADKFDSLKMGSPLLVEDEDYDALVKILADETKDKTAEDTAIVFMATALSIRPMPPMGRCRRSSERQATITIL